MPVSREDLEDLIDKNSLHAVLDALADICREKATHLRHDWQDGLSAKAWDRAAKAIDKAYNVAAHPAI